MIDQLKNILIVIKICNFLSDKKRIFKTLYGICTTSKISDDQHLVETILLDSLYDESVWHISF